MDFLVSFFQSQLLIYSLDQNFIIELSVIELSVIELSVIELSVTKDR